MPDAVPSMLPVRRLYLPSRTSRSIHVRHRGIFTTSPSSGGFIDRTAALPGEYRSMYLPRLAGLVFHPDLVSMGTIPVPTGIRKSTSYLPSLQYLGVLPKVETISFRT